MWTIVTFFLNVGVLYLFFNSWFLAFAITMTIFIHEMGHVIGYVVYGIEPRMPIFVPPLGAFVAAEIPVGQELDEDQEAMVGYFGPLFGGAFVAIAIYYFLYKNPNYPHAGELIITGILSSLSNLVNLCPVRPLDGGTIIPFLSKTTRYLGMLFLGLYFILIPFPITFAILLYALVRNDYSFIQRILAAAIINIGLYFRLTYSSTVNPGAIEVIILITSTLSIFACLFGGRYAGYDLSGGLTAKWRLLFFSLASFLVISIGAFIGDSNINTSLTGLMGRLNSNNSPATINTTKAYDQQTAILMAKYRYSGQVIENRKSVSQIMVDEHNYVLYGKWFTPEKTVLFNARAWRVRKGPVMIFTTSKNNALNFIREIKRINS